MGNRRKSRESALQILYQWEYNPAGPEEIFIRYWELKKTTSDVREYAEWLVQGILAHREEVDLAIQEVSRNWRLNRMTYIDRNILRIAAYELLWEKAIPPAVVINEAIEIAKKYSGQEAALFVNGLLDALKKKMKTPHPSATEEVIHVRKKRKSDAGSAKSGLRRKKERPGDRAR